MIEKPTPFEIASLAATLALQSRNPDTPPENFLPVAIRLWSRAAEELKRPTAEEDRDWMVETLGLKTHTFEDLLKIINPQAGKKGITRLAAR